MTAEAPPETGRAPGERYDEWRAARREGRFAQAEAKTRVSAAEMGARKERRGRAMTTLTGMSRRSRRRGKELAREGAAEHTYHIRKAAAANRERKRQRERELANLAPRR